MLEPISKTKRSLLLVFFCMLFLVLIPVILFRSLGYRFDKEGFVVSTGGIYFNLDDRSLEIYIDGVKTEEKGFLSNGLFVSDLHPKVYSVEAKKPDYSVWQKNIEVFPQKVTEASPFVVLTPATSTEVLPKVLDQKTGILAANEDYTLIANLFKNTATTTEKIVSVTNLATTTRIKKGLVIQNKTELFIEDNRIVALWTGSDASIPFYFCSDEGALPCSREINIVIGPNQKITQVDFHPERRDLIIVADNKRIYVTELDRRSPENSFTLFEGMAPEFRINDAGELFVKQKNRYFLFPF